MLDDIDMISQFPSDPLHVCDLGFMKKMLNLITKMLSKSERENMSTFYKSFAKRIPSKFSGRKPRSLDDLKYFKGTEFRLIVLYTGMVLFKPFLNRVQYTHFLYLSIALRILSSERADKKSLKFAQT